MTTKAELDARARGLDFATLNLPWRSKAQKAAAARLEAPKPAAKAKAAKVIDAAQFFSLFCFDGKNMCHLLRESLTFALTGRGARSNPKVRVERGVGLSAFRR